MLRRLARVEKLLGELLRADAAARAPDTPTPPEIRSALLDVGAEVERLLSEGWDVMAEVHAAVHGGRSLAPKDQVRRWETSAELVLFELLAALELNAE